MSFIDIHGHYAWNIDDGMPSYEDARKALELARENRISAIVATPHELLVFILKMIFMILFKELMI